MKISAVIIAKNEQEAISDALESLDWVDEIILVDTGSNDKTIEIAERHKAKVFKTQGGNFSDWRNLGAEKATGDWLLYLDADERITPLLRSEIKRVLQDSGALAFAIPRKNILLGHAMRWGGWSPDYVVRLIKKDALKGWEGELHEQPRIEAEIRKLTQSLVHITHTSLSEMVEKTNYWSEIEARLLFESGHPPMAWWRFITIALREFWFRGVTKLGFLDGPIGIIEVIYQIFNRLIVYAKLWELQQKGKTK